MNGVNGHALSAMPYDSFAMPIAGIQVPNASSYQDKGVRRQSIMRTGGRRTFLGEEGFFLILCQSDDLLTGNRPSELTFSFSSLLMKSPCST